MEFHNRESTSFKDKPQEVNVIVRKLQQGMNAALNKATKYRHDSFVRKKAFRIKFTKIQNSSEKASLIIARR